MGQRNVVRLQLEPDLVLNPLELSTFQKMVKKWCPRTGILPHLPKDIEVPIIFLFATAHNYFFNHFSETNFETKKYFFNTYFSNNKTIFCITIKNVK